MIASTHTLRNMAVLVVALLLSLNREERPRDNIGAECCQNSQVHEASCSHDGRIAALF
jgi:hypothetical protein